ncbi:hypothetical protein GSI_07859 [Ganoderma sinense ZZ0214-1]|uniref:Uncharacterized protein n=1 Tax=Ganoderma sinense ZZ0214-1 TaxID=1077348 RepID=A0A2G8S8U0_9APHY|nr:hypothetical protein GSI_07859 [Ganoderma sinense ZZ0214-1]
MRARVAFSPLWLAESTDPEFDDCARWFEKLVEDINAYTDAVTSLFTIAVRLGKHSATVFPPFGSEYELESKRLDAEHTKDHQASQGAPGYSEGELEEHHEAASLACRSIQQLVDEATAQGEDAELGGEPNEHYFIKTVMKEDLPRFLLQATTFIDPLFRSFCYMQLNSFCFLLEKLHGIAGNWLRITSDYKTRQSAALERLEALTISRRMLGDALRPYSLSHLRLLLFRC